MDSFVILFSFEIIGGGKGIRTLASFGSTRFPSVPLWPLEYSSEKVLKKDFFYY